MNMVENIIDLIYEDRVGDLDTLINEKGIMELEKKALNTEDIDKRDDIIFEVIVKVMELSYKTGFKDSFRLLLEMINIKN